MMGPSPPRDEYWATEDWRTTAAKHNTKHMSLSQFDNIRTVILGGGSVKCITYVGVISALRKNGMDLADVAKRIIGTSAGAMCALFIVLKVSVDDMVEDIVKLTQMNMDGLMFLREGHFNDMSDLRKRIQAALQKAGLSADTTMEDLQTHTGIELGAISVDLVTGEQVLQSSWTTPDLCVAEVICDSMRLPVLFPSRDTKTQVIYDGGIVNNFPIDFANDPKTTFAMRTGAKPDEVKPDPFPVAPTHTMTSTVLKLKRILEIFAASINYRVFGNQYNAMLQCTLFLDVPFLSITDTSLTPAQIDATLKLGETYGRFVATKFLHAAATPESVKLFTPRPMMICLRLVDLMKCGVIKWDTRTRILHITLNHTHNLLPQGVSEDATLMVTQLQLVQHINTGEDCECDTACHERFDMLLPPAGATMTREGRHYLRLESIFLEAGESLTFGVLIRGDGDSKPCDALFRQISVTIGLSVKK